MFAMMVVVAMTLHFVTVNAVDEGKKCPLVG